MRRPVVLATALAVLVLGVGAEGAARWLEPGLSSAGTWPQGKVAEQFSDVQRASDQAPVDVVFAGSSMVIRGIDAERFSERTGLVAVNAALPASTNIVLEPWIGDVVIPMLRPKVVVIGIASRDFNDSKSGVYRALLSSPGYTTRVGDDWLSRLERESARHSALVRIRRSIREPSNVIDALDGEATEEPFVVCPPTDPARERYALAQGARRYRLGVLANFETGGRQTTAIGDAIERFRRDGARVLLMDLATSPDYPQAHPDGPADVARYEDSLGRVIDRTDVGVIDATGIDDIRWFRDLVHMNCAGRRAFTDALADAWDDLAATRDGERTSVEIEP